MQRTFDRVSHLIYDFRRKISSKFIDFVKERFELTIEHRFYTQIYEFSVSRDKTVQKTVGHLFF